MFRLPTALLLMAAFAAPALAQDGDPAVGEKTFTKCKACHSIASDDKMYVRGGHTGPDLYGVIGRQAGTYPGFRYGDDIVKAGEEGLVWNTQNIQEYLANPRKFLSEKLGHSARAKMTFMLHRNAADVAAYLDSFSDKDKTADGK